MNFSDIRLALDRAVAEALNNCDDSEVVLLSLVFAEEARAMTALWKLEELFSALAPREVLE